MTNEIQSVFQTVDAKRRALLVAEQILDAIQVGTLQPGDRLPSERSLADQTGVSRPSVREALSALQLVGALETRHGQGTFISDRAQDITSFSHALNDLYQSEGLAESLELRRVIEKATAFLVIKRNAAEHTRELRRAFLALQKAAERRDFDAFNAANTDFHNAFAAASDNSLLVTYFSSLSRAMLSRLGTEIRKQRYWTEPHYFDASLALHRTIVDAVEAGSLERLLEAIDAHYDEIEQSL